MYIYIKKKNPDIWYMQFEMLYNWYKKFIYAHNMGIKYFQTFYYQEIHQ